MATNFAARSRFFIAVDQSSDQAKSPTFLIRTAIDTAPVSTASQKMIEHLDAALPIESNESLEERMKPMMAEAGRDRIVRSPPLRNRSMHQRNRAAHRYRSTARPGRVISMILRETASLIAVGLVIGVGLAYVASRLIDSRLYGVAALDPMTFSLAAALLLSIGFLAAYFPARRASTLDPVRSLRQE